ncbi:MAG: hypothetical protein HW380_3144 [Magnetococcales bacterium]|nr:hypothetical protein [Magnetococcales bacterium]
MVAPTDLSEAPLRHHRSPYQPFVLVFLVIFLPAAVVTIKLDVFHIFVAWVLSGRVWFLDELVSMLLLCMLPFMAYLSYRLFRLNRTLQIDEETIRRLHQRNESILHAVGDGIFGLNGAGRMTVINASAARMLGESPEKLMDSHLFDILGLPSATVSETVGRALERTWMDGQTHLCAQDFFYRMDGTSFPVEYSSSPLDPRNPRAGAVVTFRDISRRLQIEAELNRLAAAVNQTEEMIVITDAQGNIIYVNSAFETMTLYPRHEVLGCNVAHLPEKRLMESWSDKVSQAISQGIPFKQRFPAPKKDGTLFQADITWSAVRDSKGRITGHVVVGRDITRELGLGRHLKKSQRLEAVGTLAGGIAHDFNNILTAILSYTELTMDDLDPKGSEYRNLNEVMEAANRAKDLVKQLLTFSRRGERERIPLLLSPTVKETTSLLMAVLPDKITLETFFPTEEDPVLADSSRIHQVVMNLCTNAAEAMEKTGGVIKVCLERVQVDQTMIANHGVLSRLRPGLHMVLTVQDQGGGIDATHIDRLFDPFFTTKSIGKGSGLGLSVVHGIVQTHEGAIKIDSLVGKGAIFQVFLPSALLVESELTRCGQRSRS